MKYNSLKNIILLLACVGTFLFPTLTADAAELSAVVNAGVATAMEQVDDETVLAAATAPSVVEGYSLLGVVTAEKGYINIREEMSTESDVVGKIRKDGICEVVSIEEDWCEIESGEIKGYISSEYLLTGAEANEKAEEFKKNVLSEVDRSGISVSVGIVVTNPEEDADLDDYLAQADNLMYEMKNAIKAKR